MVLGKLPVPGRPAKLDNNSRTRASALAVGAGGSWGHIFSHLSFLPLSGRRPDID